MSASTQNQALSAILFLYSAVLGQQLAWMNEIVRAASGSPPNVPFDWAWQWVFPATRFYVDRETGERRRHHLHESVLQRAVKDAARAARISRPATPHSRAIRSRPTSWKPAMTSARSKNYLGTETSVLR